MNKLWWLNDESKSILNRGYLQENETVDDAIDRIASSAANRQNKPEWADKFKELIENGWISLSSPVWANMGTERGLPISCFNVHVPDSMEGITDKLGEVIMQTKLGGGTSGYFGSIRSRGSNITGNGKSSGAVSFMKLFDTAMDTVSQGGVRRGAFAAYLDIDHPDIEEFLEIKDIGSTIQNLFNAVNVSDEWMQEMIDGDKEKREIWAKVLKSRQNKGLPYIFFTDNVNNNKPDVYKEKNMMINSSNLCLVGGDRVVSNFGYLTAKELYDIDEELILFDGEKEVKSSKMKLREKNADVYKMTLDNGMEQTVTEYHGIAKIIDDRNTIVRTELKDIKIGDRVAIQTNKGLFGNKDMRDEAFLLGLYQSDGTQHRDTIMLDIWENDFDILEEVQEKFDKIFHKYGCDNYEISNQFGKSKKTRKLESPKFKDCIVREDSDKKMRLSSNCLKKSLNFEKGYVPTWIWESNEETQWEYVKGLLIADGTAHMSNSKGKPIQIAYVDINKEFLKELQILFQNLGLQTSIRLMRKGGRELFSDGKGSQKYYDTKDCWRLIVGNKNDALLINEKTHFLDRKNIILEKKEYRNNTKKSYKVISIEYVGKEDVYCPTVYNDDHIFVSNGVKTFNCSEIALPSNDDESFVCCLLSMNLELYDEWKDTDAIKYATYLLDCIMQEFIDKTRYNKYLKSAHNFAKRHRALGIGVLGWHSYLQKNMIPFEG